MCLGGGSRLVHADTLCIHGDTPEAIVNAIAVREAVNRAW
ncbi:MAG TPA: LamB/YcsF family protein [Limnobacter sp.]|nr:LamB/YcsF family protein [Limnobacter sp.]